MERKKLSQLILNIFWQVIDIVCYVSCCAYCAYQCWELWAEFFTYPTTVVVSTYKMPFYDMPAVTICSSYGIKRPILDSMSLHHELGNQSGISEEIKDTKRPAQQKEQSVLDFLYRSYMKKNQMEQVLKDSLNFSQFLPEKWMRCSADELKVEKQCLNMSKLVISSFQSRYSCFTFFHSSKMEKKQYSGLSVPPGIRQSPFVMGSVEVNSDPIFKATQPGEMFRFVIDVNKNSSINIINSPFARLQVHSRTNIIAPRDDPFNVHTSKFMIIYVYANSFYLLPAPYESNCFIYPEFKKEAKHPFFQVPRSKEDCIKACIIESVITRCKCWPPEIPYISVDSLPDKLKKKFEVPLCDWIVMSEERNPSAFQEVLDKYNQSSYMSIEYELQHISKKSFDACYQGSQECKKKCHIGCFFVTYGRKAQVVDWPSKEVIKYSVIGEYLKNLTHCCILVSIRYGSPMMKAYRMQPKYELVETLTTIGGLVSLWLGFTFIGIWTFLDQAYSFLLKCRGKGDRAKSDGDEFISRTNSGRGGLRFAVERGSY